jgi:hypothetical protein
MGGQFQPAVDGADGDDADGDAASEARSDSVN